MSGAGTPEMWIDAHVHVWDVQRSPYTWLRGLDPIDRTLLVDDVRPALTQAGIGGVVLVQSDDTDADTDVMREVAAADPTVRGIVAYAPLHLPAEAEPRLAEFAADPAVVGIRTLVHMSPDPEWMMRPDFQRGLALVAEAGLTFDLIGVNIAHMRQAMRIADAHPDLTIVLDHLCQPPLIEPREPWWSAIGELAARPNVTAKLSGLYRTSPALAAADAADIRPVFDRALAAFGADRLLYGGDWPIAQLAGGYGVATAAVRALAAELAAGERDAVMGGTARRVYRLTRP